MRPTAYTGPYPIRTHRTLAELARAGEWAAPVPHVPNAAVSQWKGGVR